MKPKSNIEDLQSPHTYHNINMQIIDDAEWLVCEDEDEDITLEDDLVCTH